MLCDKLRIGCRVALPARLRTDEQGHTTIAIKRQRGGLRAIIAAGLDISCDADTAQPTGAFGLRRALVESIPVGEFLRARERAGEIARIVDFPGRGLIR